MFDDQDGCEWALASTPPGMPGTHPPNILVGGTSTGISPPILLRTFGYSRPILVALRSLSLKPFSFGYKTPPIRFSQAGGQSAHKARPPNLELALTPLRVGERFFWYRPARVVPDKGPLNGLARASVCMC